MFLFSQLNFEKLGINPPFKACLIYICGALRDLVPLVQLKNVKNTHGGVLILVFRLQPATLLKLTLLHGCFSHFLSCTNGTKSRNAPHVKFLVCDNQSSSKSLVNAICLTTFLKSHFGMGVLPYFCCIFSEHLFP